MTISLGDLLKDTGAAKPEPKTEEPNLETKTEEGSKEAETETPPVDEEKKSEPQEEKKVPIKALHEARREKRELRRENEELKKRLEALEKNSSFSNPAYEDATETPKGVVSREEYLNRNMIQSVNLIQRTATDAVEMLAVFDDAVEENPELYAKMRESADPGAFAYEYGKSIKNQEKYGETPEEAYKRGVAEAEKATKIKVQNEMKTKKELGDKLPKNLSQGGTSGSGAHTAGFKPPSSKELWG